jgi:hypothetical protein
MFGSKCHVLGGYVLSTNWAGMVNSRTVHHVLPPEKERRWSKPLAELNSTSKLLLASGILNTCGKELQVHLLPLIE